jgi:hypothetical protein
MHEWLGWIATALFAVSYSFKKPKMLLRVQLLAALVWISYGWSIHSRPVVVANMVVAIAAGLSSVRGFGRKPATTAS